MQLSGEENENVIIVYLNCGCMHVGLFILGHFHYLCGIG